MSFPARTLTDPITFVIEVGSDGFNAYRSENPASCLPGTLFAASSAMSTFVKVMEQIAGSHGYKIHFQVTPELESGGTLVS